MHSPGTARPGSGAGEGSGPLAAPRERRPPRRLRPIGSRASSCCACSASSTSRPSARSPGRCCRCWASTGCCRRRRWLERMQASVGSRLEGFLQLPSLFWLDASDPMLLGVALLGARALAAAARSASRTRSSSRCSGRSSSRSCRSASSGTATAGRSSSPRRASSRSSCARSRRRAPFPGEPAAGRGDLAAALADLPRSCSAPG